MKFTVATKPLSSALNLGIVPGNISRFFTLSCMVQLTSTSDELKINIETSKVCTELKLKGHGDEPGPVTTFVDSATLRSLVSTLESTTLDIEYVDSGVIIHSGRSKFNLSKMSDTDELDLKVPVFDVLSDSVPIVTAQWRFIKEHQMYALAMSFITPIYRNIWISAAGESMVGDYDNSVFTLSHNGGLGQTCLLSDTIVNLINSLPSGAKLFRNGRDFIVTLETDSFTYASQFTPDYENEGNVGSYNAEIIKSQLAILEENCVEADNKSIVKFISQADLLSDSSDDTLKVLVKPDVLHLSNESLSVDIPVTGPVSFEYEQEFRIAMLKLVIGHMDDDTIHLSPVQGEDNSVVGIVFSTKSMSVVLASID